jgi:flagellar FliL protein
MAKRDRKGPDSGAADATVAEGAEVGAKKKGKFILILLPLILLGLGGGGFLAYSQYVPLVAMMRDEAPAGEDAGEPVEYGEFTELDNLIVNPAGTDGTRYLMIKIAFESDKAKALEEITEKDVVVRDAILRLLQAKTVEELAAIEQRDELKEEVRRGINEILEKGKITRLYFTQYVLQ